jgi:subtilisin-like proprotein convertase family protein
MQSTARKRRRLVTAIVTVTVLATTVFAGAAQAAPTKVKKTVSSDSPVAIPDWAEPVDGSMGSGQSTIQVSGLLGTITKVSASLYISHPATSDLDAGIIGPDGSSFAYLFDRTGTNGSGFGTGCADEDRTTFDDAASASIDAGTSPYVGTYRPMDSLNVPLSVFNGNAAGTDGTWILDVFDQQQGSAGTIECWSLFIETDAGQALRFDSSGGAPISDAVDPAGGPGVGTSAVTMTGLTGGVASVTVAVWISHPRTSDLDVVLVSPTGQEIKLAAQVGGTGSDFGTSCSKPTTFDGSAKAAIAQGVAPFVGSFRPTESLTRLLGLPANGEWTLRAIDRVGNNQGQINCWSLSVTASTATMPTGVVVTPRLVTPQPLPGTFAYVYSTIKNTTPGTLTNVSLSGTLPKELSALRLESTSFPNCDVSGSTYTCTWPSIAPGDEVLGGAVAKIGSPKKGTFCLTSTATATGIGPIAGTNCFDMGTYPAGDRGTGYAIGDVAHDLVLRDQHGDLVSLSQFAGKYVLLQFTAVWCPPSQFEVPQDRDEIAALNDTNAMGTEVVYLTVLLDGPNAGRASTQQHAQNWATKFALTSPVLTTTEDAVQSGRQQHVSYSFEDGQPLPAVPTSIFIRPNGTIFGIRVGVEEVGGTTDRFLSDLP